MENQEITPNSNEKTEVKSRRKLGKKWIFGLLAVVGTVLAFFVLILWKDNQIKQVKEEYTQKANAVMSQNSEEMLKNFCKPLSWTVRAELMRNNNEQVMLFMNELVKTKNIRMVSFVNAKNMIEISTDKNFEGKAASVLFQPNQITTNAFLLNKKTEKIWEVSTPIMAVDKKLGTIIFTYIPAMFE